MKKRLSRYFKSMLKRIFFKSDYLFVVLFILLTAISLFKITSTYNLFWQTFDEPYYVARGMEWLDKDNYSKEKDYWHNEAAPLPGIATAIGPYIKGLRATGLTERHEEGTNILHSTQDYESNLAWARAGILPFFLIATIVVFLWSNILFGKLSALLSVLLFTTLPAILAHSGLATSDIAASAMLTLALFILWLWLENPTLLLTSFLGITFGLATFTKYSNIAFLCGAGMITFALYILKVTTSANGQRIAKYRLPKFLISILIATLVIWAGFGFSAVPLVDISQKPYALIDRITGESGLLHEVAYFIVEHIYIPAPDFFLGLLDVIDHNRLGHWAYLFGEVYTDGRWYFFPVAIVVKTPISFLLLSIIGAFHLFKQVIKKERDSMVLVPLVSGICILAIAMSSNLNLGSRHILSIFPLLAIVAGYGGYKIWRLNFAKIVGPSSICVSLIIWQLLSSATAYPNYLAYYNELGGKNPEDIVVDTTDWGQDLKYLAQEISLEKIENISLCYSGSADLEKLKFPSYSELIPYKETYGWVAISLLCRKFGTWEKPYDQFAWLDKYDPVKVIGKTINLYYIQNKSSSVGSKGYQLKSGQLGRERSESEGI